jgi:ribonucleoside-diphosphate reductase alpha chain
MTKFNDPLSEEVWNNTYKDHNDITVDDTFRRVAKAVASVEKNALLRTEWEQNFFEMLSDFNVTTGGRIYSNAGAEWAGTTLMNCFVGPHPKSDMDSLNGIMDVLRDQANTLKSEGGWGFNFSWLRFRGEFIKGIGVESPGAVTFMELFDKSSEIVTSGSGMESTNENAKGKIRKGAMMGVMDVWHPDIIEFITAKQTPKRLSKFNLSVNCTDEFMAKVNHVEELRAKKASQEEIDAITWDLKFPETTHPKYKTTWFGDIKAWEAAGNKVNIIRTVSVEWLWNLIMDSTYNRAEPGVLFIDRANRINPLAYKETIYATNPCGEQTLSPGNICNLISMNLVRCINKDRTGFDLAKVRRYVRWMVRFADNINDLSTTPLPEYTESMQTKRRIGCGILGWGSALYMLKVRFGSDKASELRDELMKTFTHAAAEASIDLAKEKGMFKLCDPAKHAQAVFWDQIGLPKRLRDMIAEFGIRNSSLFSIQPTGNTSAFANVVSGGLEPVFLPDYIRTVIVNTMPDHIADVTPKWYEGEFFETSMFKLTKEGTDDVLRGTDAFGTVYKIDKNRGLCKEVECEDYGTRFMKEVGEWDANADWAATTANLSTEDHVRDLIGFSKWLDSACSKTVNVPNNYPYEAFKNVYLDAFNSGVVKGVTTYRAGTMASVLAAKDEILAEDSDEEIIKEDVKMPSDAVAKMKTLKAGGKKWYVTVTFFENNFTRPFALFVHTNSYEKGVSTNDAVDRLIKLARRKKIPKRHIDSTLEKIENENNASKLARTISFLLRHGVLIKNIVTELEKVEDIFVGSFLFQIRKFLSQYIKDGTAVEDTSCDTCHSNSIVFQEGCFVCMSCGSSKCG